MRECAVRWQGAGERPSQEYAGGVECPPDEEAAPGARGEVCEAEELERPPYVPEDAHREGRPHVDGTVAAISPERNVHAVTQPQPERDVPAMPEVGRLERAPGCVEVLDHHVAGERTEADGHVRPRGEAQIEPDVETRAPAPEHETARVGGSVRERIDPARGKEQRGHGELRHAEGDAPKPRVQLA